MRGKAPLSLVLFLAFVLSSLVPGAASAAEHRFGLGANYWQALDDLASELDIDEDGLAPYFTYQYAPAGIFKLELDVEYFGNGFGGATSESFSPSGWVILEWGLYGGVGVGVTVADSLDGNVSDPFYGARLGWDFQVLPKLHVDVNVNYRANSFTEIEELDIDSDSVMLGAAVRIAFGSR